MDLQTLKDKILSEAVERLTKACGPSLAAVVLYGPAAHGDFYEEEPELHLLLVLRNLELTTLATLGEPMAWWLKKGQPIPRVFSAELIADSADVFPMELSDLLAHRIVLHGEDPFPQLSIDADHLRLQCEREIREKMMRLREAFIEARGKDKHLSRLMAESYLSFVMIFRGSLRLRLNAEVPQHDAGVVDSFSEWAGLDAAPLHRVESIKHGRDKGDAALFADYYTQLTRAVEFIDGFINKHEVNP